MKTKNSIQTIILLLLVSMTSFISKLYAQEYTVIQLDKPSDCAPRNPKINNGQVAWLGTYLDSDRAVFLYNGAQVNQLTRVNYNIENLQIDNGQVVWQGWDSSYPNIFLYNGSEVVKLTNDAGFSKNPQISNGQVVWVGTIGGLDQIFLYDGIITRQLTNNSIYNYQHYFSPHIDNGKVVWAGDNDGDLEIFLYDDSRIIQLTNNNVADYNPTINNNQIAWFQNQGNSAALLFYDGSSTIKVADDVFFFYEEKVQLNNGQVAYTKVIGGYVQVFLYNGQDNIQLTNTNYDNLFPILNNGQIVWQAAIPGYRSEIFLYDGSTTIQLTSNNLGNSRPSIYDNRIAWLGHSSINDGLGQIYLAIPNYWTLNISGMPWHQNTAPYNSTGAAVSQMILDYIREGATQPLLTQNEIYEYAKSPQTLGPELTPDEIDKALGHFDPYDTLVSNWADSYDTLLDGNPYQGYNYTVDTYDPITDPEAMNKYMRDICHWMAYTVTKEDWWLDGELVARPNTPAAIPIYGTYNHWVAIKGFAANTNPCPEPHTNPFNLPDFTVYGFWIKDPLLNGIGQDTYKTAAECTSTYFLPLSTSDNYNGKFVQIAEPPPGISHANVQIPKPTKDMANLAFIGVKNNLSDSNNSTQLKSLSLNMNSVAINNKPSIIIKKDWRDILPPQLLLDPECQAAFNGTKKGKPILVKRADTKNSDYYLVPFNKRDKRRSLLTSGVVILDANAGYFKEVSWTKTPEKFLKVNDKDALRLIKNYIFKDFSKRLRKLPRTPLKNYLKQRDILYKNYMKLLGYVETAKAELFWKANSSYSLSPYQPYWKIDINGYIWYVTQEAKVIPETKLDKIIGEIEANRKVLERF